MNVLLVGLGRWGENHLRVLSRLGVTLWVADVSPARLDWAVRDCVIVVERGALVADYGASTVTLHRGEHLNRGGVWEAVETGDMRLAQSVYREMSERTPRLDVWLDLARSSMRIEAWREARRAAGEVLALEPGHAEATEILAAADRRLLTRAAAPTPTPFIGAHPAGGP